MTFEEEIKSYTIDELELIISTQEDLYSEEEMTKLKNQLTEKRLEEEKRREEIILSRLPDTILCEKCDGPNDFSNTHCAFCGYELNKEKYYTDEYYLSESEEESYERERYNKKDGYTFQRVISFLIPFVGLIIGAIMLANDSEEKRDCGKTCILLSVASIAINMVLIFL